MQMLGPNNEVPSKMKIKYVSPRPKSKVEQQSGKTKQSVRNAYAAAVWKIQHP